MKKLLPLLALLALLATSSVAQNQSYYTIQVGTFIDAKPGDFKSLQPIAFVHANDLGNNLREVYVGGYSSREEAEKAAAKVRDKGYANAFVQERLLSTGQAVNVVQMATRRVDKAIEWEEFMKVGEIYGILSGNLIKIVTGPYASLEAAKGDQSRIRNLGYKDAFAKAANTAYLIRLTEFETGVKQDLFPIAFQQPGGRIGTVPAEPQVQDYNVLIARTPDVRGTEYTYGEPAVTDYNYTPAVTTPRSVAPSMPNIRADIKRESVMSLQTVLKAENAYNSSIDGYYGNGTASAYQAVMQKDRTLRKYQALAESAALPGSQPADSELQQAVNELGSNPAVLSRLERSNDPMALAYRAYLLLASYGPSADVNRLMNTAIRAAFSGRMVANLPFDPNATYAYQNLSQLVSHLYYMHCGSATNISAPCWLAERYPQESALANQACARVPGGNLRVQNCGQFDSWPEARLLVAIAAGLNPEEQFNQERLSQAAAERSRLYAAPSALNSAEAKAVESWNSNLLRGLDAWAVQDPLHRQLTSAFKVAYFQAQVRLEDYFMNKGYKVDQARGLALATLHTLVAYHLQRFV
ncbi:MAG: SPOR domain-containing protein [Lewinellaceae bacterium]|nr:SPOR domain-containing protein [Phaeodactylibacter sp.]MCB9039342.1 SPOR domain-containing protein [Lewinellaceae bacterium]